MDRISPEQRSSLMSKIRCKNTKPELIVRRLIHAMGYRFRLHRRSLPGCPDLVFPRLKKVVFVHGCFWHHHHNCKYAYIPKSNSEFWRAKFKANVERDEKVLCQLKELGWKVLIIWECETKHPKSLSQQVEKFLGDNS